MVNLLFISDHAKIKLIVNALRPLLKAKIESVGDFDYGLKDVFEKRPTVVFIQDQIADVTGESVARHIQMLLGSGAPVFVFLYNGGSKPKTVTGLYEHLVDLSQSDARIVSDIQSTLKYLLAPQWEKILLTSETIARDAIKKQIKADGIEVADNQITDNNVHRSDKNTLLKSTDISQPDIVIPTSSDNEPFSFISSPNEEVADQLVESGGYQKNTETPPLVANNHVSKGVRSHAEKNTIEKKITEKQSERSNAEMPSKQLLTTLSSPADFRIDGDSLQEYSDIRDQLQIFEDEYLCKRRAHKRNIIIVIVVVVLCVTGGVWYQFVWEPETYSSGVGGTLPQPLTVKAPATSLSSLQKPSPETLKSEKRSLPSFIPQSGYDSTYSSRKPGWERYVDSSYEFRVYYSAAKLKAVQIIAINGHEISEPMLVAVLSEIAGSGEYHVTSHEKKPGYQVVHASVNNNAADMLIYRKESMVQAVVVSLN